MVTRALHGVTDSIADALTFQTRRQRTTDDMLRQLEDVRRMAAYNRDRLIRDNRRRRRPPITSTEIEAAVVRAMESSKDKDEPDGG